MFTAGILTASDKGSQGLRKDTSSEVISEMLEAAGYTIKYYEIVPDEQAIIEDQLKKMCDEVKVDLVVTTGGTGFSPRDITPEATQAVIEKAAPGIAEAMRYASLQITPKAMLSRGVAGIRKQTLIINLPGSPKAVRENLQSVLPTLTHGLEIMLGRTGECGQR